MTKTKTYNDEETWQLIQGCCELISQKHKFKYIQLGDLISFFLWDKVGCAIRNQSEKITSTYRFEESKERSFFSTFIGRIKNRYLSFKRKQLNKPFVYFPFVTPRLQTTMNLVSAESCFYLSSRKNQVLPHFINFKTPSPVFYLDKKLAMTVYNGIVDYFEDKSIFFSEEALNQLGKELEKLFTQLELVYNWYAVNKPDLVVVHADNHPPHQTQVLVARSFGIPVLMLQHGLDCEHFFLDQAYASHMALWGKNRKKRYQTHSKFQPIMEVTGNPEYDSIKIEPHENTGEYWLWVTRPHSETKCYLPSRKTDEGIHILKSLTDQLKKYPNRKLIIKAHPYDDYELYHTFIKTSNLQDKIEVIKEGSLNPLLAQASIVFTEDSTAGLEAMFQKCPLIHIHFTEQKPVLDFVTYDAALPAFDDVQLENSIHTMESGHFDKENMLKGQERFIADHAYKLDGKAGERVLNFIKNIIR